MADFVKYGLVVLLAAFLQSKSGMAQAVKVDVTKPATTVMEQGGKVQGNAQDLQKGAEHVKTYQKMLDGAKEGISKLKELKQQAGDLKTAAGNLKSSVDGAVETAKSTASSLATLDDAQQLVNLQTMQAQAKSNYEQQVKNLEADRDASIKKYQDNNKVIEETIAKNPEQKSVLQPQIDENNAKIKEITDKYQKLIDSSKQVYERTNASYAEQISSLQSAAANVDPLSNVNAESAKKMVSGLFGGDAGVAMNEIIAKNFYAKDEEESTERNGELTNYRRDTALTDSADVYYQAVQIMSIGDMYLDYVKSLQNNAQVTETTPAAVTLDLTIKVENMRSLLNYARLLVAEMKMLTAQDMVSLPKKLNNYSKDVTAFNLDDYEYKEKKKSLLEQAKDMKKKAEDAVAAGKDIAGSVAETAGSVVSAGASAVNSAAGAAASVGSAAGSATSAVGDVTGQVSSVVN